MLVEGRPASDSGLVGKSVTEAAWPADTLVLSVRRGDETLFAAPDRVIGREDELLLVTRSEHLEEIRCRLAPLLDEVSTTTVLL